MSKVVDMSDYRMDITISCEQEPEDRFTFTYHNYNESSIGVIVDLKGYEGIEHIYFSEEDSLKLRDFLIEKLGNKTK